MDSFRLTVKNQQLRGLTSSSADLARDSQDCVEAERRPIPQSLERVICRIEEWNEKMATRKENGVQLSCLALSDETLQKKGHQYELDDHMAKANPLYLER